MELASELLHPAVGSHPAQRPPAKGMAPSAQLVLEPSRRGMMPSARPAIHVDAALAEPPGVARSRRYPRWPVLLFLLSITVPVFFWIGPLRLSPYRLFLLVSIIPLLGGLLLGRCGRILRATF